MEGLTSEQTTLLIVSTIFAVVFFIMVTVAIVLFFKRLEKQDRAETNKFQEPDDKADQSTTGQS